MPDVQHCPTTGKVRFHTETAAQLALTDAKIARAFRSNTKRREQGAYQCEFCHGFHLTSKTYQPQGDEK